MMRVVRLVVILAGLVATVVVGVVGAWVCLSVKANQQERDQGWGSDHHQGTIPRSLP